jgi:hypothetical protein
VRPERTRGRGARYKTALASPRNMQRSLPAHVEIVRGRAADRSRKALLRVHTELAYAICPSAQIHSSWFVEISLHQPCHTGTAHPQAWGASPTPQEYSCSSPRRSSSSCPSSPRPSSPHPSSPCLSSPWRGIECLAVAVFARLAWWVMGGELGAGCQTAVGGDSGELSRSVAAAGQIKQGA